MVWDLTTMKRMNDRAVKESRPKGGKLRIPKAIAGSPALIRRYLNRPWDDDTRTYKFADREITEKPRS